MPVRFCSSQCARRSSARGCAPRGICKDARAQTSPRWRSPRTSKNSCQSASHRRGRPHQGRWCYGKTPVKPSLTRCLLRGRNCCRPRSAGHNFVGHPPRRRANCQVNCILLHAKPSSEWRSFPTTKSRESRPSQRQHPICRSNPASTRPWRGITSTNVMAR